MRLRTGVVLIILGSCMLLLSACVARTVGDPGRATARTASAAATKEPLPLVAEAPAFSAPQRMAKEITGKDGAPMVLVPAGRFTMGSNDRSGDEKPQHEVELDTFYIDQYEVTVSRYATFMSHTNRQEPKYWNKVTLDSQGDRPVIGVNWYDAEAYCEWAGKHLPTSAEWEKAARGTDGRTYPWGDEEPTSSRANYGKNESRNPYTDVLQPVGSYEEGKSPYGAYDMAGNVWEWEADRFDKNKAKAWLRGGSWLYGERSLRSWHRYRNDPSNRVDYSGFRCAQDAP